MRVALLAAITLLGGLRVVSAQDTTAKGLPRWYGAPEWTAVERAQRISALNAIFTFRTDLSGDSTRIATCTLEAQVQDTAAARWVLPSVRHLLIEPFQRDANPRYRCNVQAFAKRGVRVLWLSSLVEVRRRGDVLAAGPTGLSFEADFDWLDGPGYRRFEHYEVQPRNAEGREWRVVRYELRGEEWIDDFGSAKRSP